MTKQEIETIEARLFALEYAVTTQLAGALARNDGAWPACAPALERLSTIWLTRFREMTVPTADPAMSDHLSAMRADALAALLEMTEAQLRYASSKPSGA